jgi:hypothetical protein
MRFLNQKLGKRVSRRVDLLKSQLAGRKQADMLSTSDLRIPKKGASREQRPTRKQGEQGEG